MSVPVAGIRREFGVILHDTNAANESQNDRIEAR